MRHLNRYLSLQQATPFIDRPVAAQLQLITVIPCMDEPAILELLDHLRSCAMPSAPVEIIIVVNHPCDAADEIRQSNAKTVAQLIHWQAANNCPALSVHLINSCELPVKASGVGIARKIGMDEAARRFAAIGRPDGIIASLDADCRVSANYFTALLQGFAGQPALHATTTAYAHRIDELSDARHRQAMICYELFLRYIELGWSHAGLPYAFTAIGSCFAVRANAYARHHGMNKRQAGEDFYFLHKLARERPLAHFSNVVVYPSARMSSRTPFGTGQAIADWYHSEQQQWPVCAPEAFLELRQMSDSLDQLFAMETAAWLAQLPPQLHAYLLAAHIEKAVTGMRANTATAASFCNRFYFWFDGLKAWRYVNRQTFMPIEQAVTTLLSLLHIAPESNQTEALLDQLRLMRR
ncbi:MAG: glycosyltransferase family 2 protein [Mariprofundus sp.]